MSRLREPQGIRGHRHMAIHCVVSAASSWLDVLLKNGVIAFAAYRGHTDTLTLGVIASLAWALFLAPYFFLSAHGGLLGDRYENRRLALALKVADLAIAAGAAYGFHTGSIPFLLGLVFAKGCTSTLFSPIRYSLVIAFLPPMRRVTGYAVLEAGSMIAILGGTYCGIILGALPQALAIGLAAVVLAAISLLGTFCYPCVLAPGARDIALGIDPIRPALRILRSAYADTHGFAAMLALSWFWALGSVYLAQTPALVRDTLHGEQSDVAAILMVFTLGVSLGMISFSGIRRWCQPRYMAFGMALLMAAAGLGLLDSTAQRFDHVVVLFLCLSLAAGVYASHYSAILYRAASTAVRARLFAANNIVSALVMVISLGISALMISMNLSIVTCLAIFAAASVPVTLGIEAMKRWRRGMGPA